MKKAALVFFCFMTSGLAFSQSLQIHAADRIGIATGKPFLYLIPVTGKGPLQFSADNLPPGLRLNIATGIVEGTATRPGNYNARFMVSNGSASSSHAVQMLVQENAAALTPMLGWNSWYVWGCNINAKRIRDAADQLVSAGLAAHGYNYINIDDCWQQGRDSKGEMQAKPSFGNMKELTDYVHSKGLRIGIYTSPGIKTCGKHPGSLGHVEQDVQTYAKWGMDLVKYDWCGAQGFEPKVYREMSSAIEKSPRSMVHMICQYGLQEVWKWGAEAGGNSWRTNNDLHDTWESITRNGFQNSDISSFAKPGHWNDLDFLMVGKSNWPLNPNDYGIPNAPPRQTRLTLSEQYTHLSIWSLMASPLIISSDLGQLDQTTKAMLTNDEVLQVDQDSLGVAAHRIVERNGTQIWARPLRDGSYAVGMFNLNEDASDMETDLQELGIPVGQNLHVRDLWQHRNLQVRGTSFSGRAEGHGVLLVRVVTK